MAYSTNARRACGVLSFVLLAILSSGCFTGHVLEKSRVHESLFRYSRATESNGELLIEYQAVRTNDPLLRSNEGARKTQGPPTETLRRVASVPIAALRRDEPIPVERFPIRRLRSDPPSAENANGRVVPLYRDPRDRPDESPPATGRFILIETHGDFDEELQLCGGEGLVCSQPFYPEALYQSSFAWWAYPLVPVAFLCDLAVLPIHIVTLPILVTTGD